MFLIARRYLLSTKSHSVVNIIAWVSLISLLLPVAAVVILLSIFNGFGTLVTEIESSVEGDLTIRLKVGRFFEMGDIDSERLQSIDGVEALSFVSEQMALLNYGGRNAVITLRGVDDNYTSTVDIESRVYAGTFAPRNDEIIIGNSVASKLGVRALNNVVIELISLKSSRLQSLIGIGKESSINTRLAGILALDQESEERYGYTSQRAINSLIGRDDVASRLSIKLSEGGDIERVKSQIQDVVGGRFKVESRSELNPTLHQIIRYEKLGVLLISTFVMLLASFSLIGALTMLIIEKSNDITTLRAMGVTKQGIHNIFFLEGVLISSTAIVGGVALGAILTLAQQYTGFVELPSSSLTRIAYPVDLQFADVIKVVAITLSLTLSISWAVTKNIDIR